MSAETPYHNTLYKGVAEFVAGSVGGFAGVFVGHPFDTVRVRLQTLTANNQFSPSAIDTFMRTFRNESFKGLYKGMLSPMIGEMGINFVAFGVFGVLKPFQDMFNRENSGAHYSTTKEALAIFGAGTIAGACTSVIVGPVELIKILLQTNTDAIGKQPVGKRGFLDCLRYVYNFGAQGMYDPRFTGKLGAFRSLFHGYAISFAREAPFGGVYFLSYEYTKRILLAWQDKDASQLGAFESLTAGGVAGTVGWLLVYPMDMVKSNVQANLSRTATITSCFKSTIATSGYKGLFKGLLTTLVRAYPTNAAIFYAYELTNRALSGVLLKE